MATYTYLSFSTKQGVLVGNGGAWACDGFDGPCIQSSGNDPIISTSAPNSAGHMDLQASINLADDEFKDATSMSFTISFKLQATAQGDAPYPVGLWTYVGGQFFHFPDTAQYNTESPLSVSHSGTFGTRQANISLLIQPHAIIIGNAIITLAFSDVSFVIHDVVYDATSAAGPSSTSALSTSSSSSTSNLGSLPTSSTNNGTALSLSTSLSTTISGRETINPMLPSQSSAFSESQSHLPSPSNSSDNSSMSTGELAGVIAGSLLGVALVLVAIAFWYQWRRRRRMARSAEPSYEDSSSRSYTSSGMTDGESWVPRPYQKRPYSLPSTGNAGSAPAEQETIESTESEGQQGRRIPPPRRGNRIPPPPYSQITPRSQARSSISSVGDG